MKKTIAGTEIDVNEEGYLTNASQWNEAIAAAIAVYAKHKAKPIEPKILADAWGYDRAVSSFMGGPGRKAFDGVAWADANVVDGAVNGTGELVRATAGKARLLQSGNVRTYAAAVGAGVVLLLVWFVVVRGIL